MPEVISFESRGEVRLVAHGVISQFGFGRRDVADGLQQPATIELVHPLQRRELDLANAGPLIATPDLPTVLDELMVALV